MMYKRDRKEPFWWGLFSLGGVVAALLVPIHIFVAGLAVPLGLLDPEVLSYESMRQLVANPWIKLYLFVLLALPLYHAAHRIRFTLHELGLQKGGRLIAILCYGGALIGTAFTAYILLHIL